jgi:hypothetical protein
MSASDSVQALARRMPEGRSTPGSGDPAKSGFMINREDLTKLSIGQLADLVLQQQEEMTQLRARVIGLDSGRAALPRGPEPVPQTERVAVATVATPLPRQRHHRLRHRPWYKRLWRFLFPGNLPKRRYLFIAALVIVLSILAGLFVALSMINRGTPSESPPAGYLIEPLVHPLGALVRFAFPRLGLG